MEKREIATSLREMSVRVDALPRHGVRSWLEGILRALEHDIAAEAEDDAERESPGFLVSVGAIEDGWRLEDTTGDYAQGSREHVVRFLEKALRSHDARRGLAVPAAESLQAEVATLKADLAALPERAAFSPNGKSVYVADGSATGYHVLTPADPSTPLQTTPPPATGP